MDELLVQFISNFSTLILALVAWKSGLLNFLTNGRFWTGRKTPDRHLEEIQKHLESFKENHFHELKEGQQQIVNKLDEIIEYGIRIRKE